MEKPKRLSGLILIILILSGFASYAQTQNLKGSVKGTVTDKANNTPLESATIQVFSSTDSSLITGAAADKSGNFNITDIPEGTYNVKVNFVGYSSAVAKDVKITSSNPSVNLGTIKLEINSELTQEIQVTSEAPVMTFEQGKQVYDVKKDLTVQNGTALDVLKNIPSIDVDNDGNVSLRGAGNVKILINGKPSAMLSNGTQILQSMPASIIEKVEIITNPSAKYEAEGNSGIINIIMKQEQTVGYNGNIKVNGGTQDKYNLSLSFAGNKNKLSLSGNYSYWNYYLPGMSFLNRNNFTSISARTIEQVFNWNYKGVSHYGSFGADYDINDKNTLSLTTVMFFFNRHIKNSNSMHFYDVSNVNTANYLIKDDNGVDGYNLDATLTHTKKFDTKDKELTSFINVTARKENNNDNYINNDFINPVLLQEKKYKWNFTFLNGQVDFVNPFSPVSKLEAGLKANARFINGDYQFNYLDNVSGNWLPYSGRANDADYTDLISAAYLTYSGGYKNFTYQLGLRGEHTYIDFSILQGSQKYNNKYFDLFPSAALTQKIGTMHQFQLTYSRRINRPNLYFLNPFVEQFDEYTKRTGNPYLKPDYTHSVELGYTLYLPVGSVTLNNYFRNTRNVLDFISYVDTAGVNTLKPDNVGKTNTLGTELILQGGFAKWWTYYGSASYYNANYFGDLNGVGFDKNYNSWSARFSTNAAIPDIVDVQLSYFYGGRRTTAQGSVDPFQSFNIAIQKNFFDKKLVIGFRVNDLFDQQRFKRINSTGDFYQDVYQKTTSRTAFLTLTFNFGEQKNGGPKSLRTQQRKQRENESEIQQPGN